MTAPTVPFTILHRDEAVFADQAKPDKIDFRISMYAGMGWAWMSGAAVHEQGSPNMTVAVDIGAVAFGDAVTPSPAGNVTLIADATNPRFALVGVDQLRIVSHARTSNVGTIVFATDPVAQGWVVGQAIIVDSSNDKSFNATATILSINSGAKTITYTTAGTNIGTTTESGAVTHVGVWHGTPTLGDKPHFPDMPSMGAVMLASVFIAANQASTTDDNIVDKRIPRAGAVPRFLNPMEFPYLCKNDGSTYDGDQFEACCQDAHRLGLGVFAPGGDGYNMVNGSTPKQIIIDFNPYENATGGTKPNPGDFHLWGSGAFGRTKLIYTGAVFPLNLDPTDPSDGDPGGRVPTGAICGINIKSDTGSLRLRDFDLVGPNPSRDCTVATDILALNLRSRGFGVNMGGGGRNHCTGLNITGFFCGFYERLNNNHNFILFCTASLNWYGQYFATNASRTGYNSENGDNAHIGCFFSSNAFAAIASDPGGIIFDAHYYSCHLGACPYGYYQEFGQCGDIVLPSNATYARNAANGVVTINTKWGTSPTWPTTAGGAGGTGGPDYLWPATTIATTIATAGAISDGTIHVGSVTGFPSSGKFSVVTVDGTIKQVTYTNTSTSGSDPRFTGCTALGSKTFNVGAAVLSVGTTTSQPPASLHPGQPFPAVWGLMTGDVLDLSELAGRIGGGFKFGSSGNIGVVASVSGDNINIVMGDYLSATDGTDKVLTNVSATAIPAIGSGNGEMTHPYYITDWLRSIGMLDSTFEGAGEGFVFSESGFGDFTQCYGTWQFHGNEVIGRNSGTMQSNPKLAVSAASRKWNRGSGTETSPASDDIYETILTVASGHGVRVGDVIFAYLTGTVISNRTGNTNGTSTVSGISAALPDSGASSMLIGAPVYGTGIPLNTVVGSVPSTSSITLADKNGNAVNAGTATGITLTFLDDFAGAGRKGTPGARATGKWEVTFVDATHIRYEQVYDNTGKAHQYTGTTAHPYTVSSGFLCTTQMMRVGLFDSCMGLTLDYHHETTSGTGLSERQIICKQMVDSNIQCASSDYPWVRLMADSVTQENTLFPANSVFSVGRGVARVMRTTEDLFAGAALEITDREDVQLFRGASPAGVCLFTVPKGDYCMVLESGPTRMSQIDYGGCVTVDSTITQDDFLAGDVNNPGFVKRALGNESIFGRCTASLVGTGPYLVPLTVRMVPSTGAATVVLNLLDTTTSLIVGDGAANYVFSVPETLDGKNLLSAQAYITTASSSGIPTFQIRNLISGGSGPFDMLSTKITIDATELDSSTAAVPVAINQARRKVRTGDQLRFDVDVAGTGAFGLGFRLVFGT